MKKFKWFLGVDVSKSKLDLTLFQDSNEVAYHQIENDQHSIKVYLKQITAEYGVLLHECLVCAEQTGIYNNPLLQVGHKLRLNVWVESALAIKLSGGISRIKNDKVDSAKIAIYAYRFQDKARLWQAPRPTVELLNQLSKQRDKLLKVKHQLEVGLGEGALYMNKLLVKAMKDTVSKPLKEIKAAIKIIDSKIENIINSDEYIKALTQIVTSVPGVGKITAVKIIVTTNEFKEINDPRKYACYGGVAPFERTSGSSIKGKPQVSKKANLSVKTLLSLCAISAVQNDPELKQFYARKVAEGKNKMSVINAVRNKIIHRVFACVNQNRLYQKNYNQVFA